MSSDDTKRHYFRVSAMYCGGALLLSSGSRAIPVQAYKFIMLGIALVVAVTGIYYYVLAMRERQAARRE